MRDERADIELVVKYGCLVDLLHELERGGAEVDVWFEWTRLASECAGEIESRVCVQESHAEDARMLELARHLRRRCDEVASQLAIPVTASRPS